MFPRQPGTTRANHIITRLIQRRRALGLTLERLAERAGMTPNYIGTIENGKRDPSLSTLLRLADALEIPLSDLVRDAEPEQDWRESILELARALQCVPPPSTQPPRPKAPRIGTPALFEIPYKESDPRQQIAPWWPRRASSDD
jgi:transcriptional regulator with XRE-family HTH domain